jgi:hypothetical protein
MMTGSGFANVKNAVITHFYTHYQDSKGGQKLMTRLLDLIITYFIEPLLWLAAPKCPECGEILTTTYPQCDAMGLTPIKLCPNCTWTEGELEEEVL